MSAYRIEPDGSWAIFHGVVAQATSISDALADYPKALTTAAEQSMSQDVANALEQFALAQKPNLVTLENHVPACAYGLGTAVNAYEAGDQQMATTTVQAAVTASATGDFSAFRKK